MENTGKSEGVSRTRLLHWHDELEATIGRVEVRLGQLKKQRSRLEAEIYKLTDPKSRMDAQWDAYRKDIKEKYLPKLESGEISQAEYDVLLDGDDEGIREFYRNREQVEKSETDK